jgi:peroxin-5
MLEWHVRARASLLIDGLLTKLGLPGLNIGMHKEAAEHFLSALEMQESTGAGSSQQLWLTLRRVFLSMVGGS